MDTYKHHTVAWQLLWSTPTGLESLSASSGKCGDGDEATLDWTRGGDEASPTPLRLQGCSTTQGNLPRLLLGWTRHLHQASFRSVSARLQVARAAASHHQALALLRSRQLVPQGWTTSTPGEHCRTQVPTSAGSGDLLPKLGEESAPSLVQDQRAAPHRSWQCNTVLVIVETKPLWCSVFRTSFPWRFWRPSPPPSFSEHSPTTASKPTAVALFQSPTSTLEANRRWLCLP